VARVLEIDFGGCRGPQSPKSTRLPFDVDIVSSPGPAHPYPQVLPWPHPLRISREGIWE
jgi:hypothetical protein